MVIDIGEVILDRHFDTDREPPSAILEVDSKIEEASPLISQIVGENWQLNAAIIY